MDGQPPPCDLQKHPGETYAEILTCLKKGAAKSPFAKGAEALVGEYHRSDCPEGGATTVGSYGCNCGKYGGFKQYGG